MNWKKDTNDSGDHLNLSGSRRMTVYIGDYLRDNCELADHRPDPQRGKRPDGGGHPSQSAGQSLPSVHDSVYEDDAGISAVDRCFKRTVITSHSYMK